MYPRTSYSLAADPGCVPGYDIRGDMLQPTFVALTLEACRNACLTRLNCAHVVYFNNRTCHVRGRIFAGVRGSNAFHPDVDRACVRPSTGGTNSFPVTNGSYYCVNDWDIRGRDVATLVQAQPVECTADPYCTFFVARTDGSCTLRALMMAGRSGTTEAKPGVVAASCILVKEPFVLNGSFG